jgi:hypothetical protein
MAMISFIGLTPEQLVVGLGTSHGWLELSEASLG